jgi:4-hydroxythreonine-4-phosphate dehydrogenase
LTLHSPAWPVPMTFKQVNRDALPLWMSAGSTTRPGILDESTGTVTVSALEAALDAVRLGHCSGLVTAPIHKANLYATGFAYPGHTEFLEAYAQEHWPQSKPLAVMMLAGPELRTVPVTVHIPLSQVTGSLTTQRIVEVGEVVARDLRQRFGIDTPRLAIAGLNPHAGEQGSLGKEDEAIIAPAVTQLDQKGIKAVGPCRRTRCSIPKHVRSSMRRSACITIKR